MCKTHKVGRSSSNCTISPSEPTRIVPSYTKPIRIRPTTYIRRKGKAITLQTWTSPTGSRNMRLPEFLDSRHMKVVRLSALCARHLYPQEILLALICVRGWVDPRDTAWPEGLSQWKIPMAPPGRKPKLRHVSAFNKIKLKADMHSCF